MISTGDKVVVGVSGGADSVCLLHILHSLKDYLDIELHAAYLNHGFRPGEAEKEASFVCKFAEELNIPYTAGYVDVPSYAKERRLSRQEAAREVRYAFLKEIAQKVNANKIAVGHTADDQAETYLLREIRGSGVKGLSAIKPVRENTIIRPLIEVRRKEIIEYLSENGIPYLEDPSNITSVYLRNRIRHELLPILTSRYNPRIVETLNRNAEILREEDEFLESYVRRLMLRLISKRKKGYVEIFLIPFLNLDRAVQRRVLRNAIEEVLGAGYGYSLLHITKALELATDGQTGKRINLPGGIVFEKSYSVIIISLRPAISSKVPLDTGIKYTLNVPGITHIPDFGVTFKTEMLSMVPAFGMPPLGDGKIEACLDKEGIKGEIYVRRRMKGDSFYPFGIGKKKKLKEFFIDEKVPRGQRDSIPILVNENGDIIWVVGYRIDERFKVTKETERVLLIKVNVKSGRMI